MESCAVKGGCISDYIAISISIFSLILLLSKVVAPYLIHNIPRPNGSSFWLVAIQVFASFNLLLSIVMALGFLRLGRWHWWRSCYIWAVWIEGPLGFGLLLSCRIVQAFQLYNIFIMHSFYCLGHHFHNYMPITIYHHIMHKYKLLSIILPILSAVFCLTGGVCPPIRSYIFLPVILLPWVAGAAVTHMKKPLNQRCHMGAQWIIPVLSLHALYVAGLVGFTAALRHIEFRFHELKDLWRGILVSTCCIGIWVVSYILNEIHEDISLVQIVSRSLLLISTSFLVLAFFSVSLSQPLVSLMSLRKKSNQENRTMGRALGIPDSGILSQRHSTKLVDPNEPLDRLLLDKRFRQSFMAFAESCLAGESVHFYEEVQQLDRIPVDDHVRRIYMVRHIIDKYIAPGATMEVNISHRCREKILSTLDLAHPNLFKNALNELLQLMKMNLVNEYWSSTFFAKFKEEIRMQTADNELEQVGGWDYSHRLSSVHCADDPFHQQHM